MGIKNIKKYLKYRLLGVILTEISEVEAYELGKGIGIFADETLDRQLGDKKSEASQAKIILRIRSLAKGVEDALMKDMNQKQIDMLNQFKKEV